MKLGERYVSLGARLVATLTLTWASMGMGPVALGASVVPLPSLGGGGPPEHHPGKIIWADLATPDLGAAERFYGGLFGWKFKTIHAGRTEYAVAMMDGQPVAGLLERPLKQRDSVQPVWLTFIAISDVDAATRDAVGHGAALLYEPKTYPGRGRQAVLADPDGAVFAMLQSSSGDPPDTLAEPGELIWSTLLARDPARESDFYKTLFGYSLFDLPDETNGVHVILSSDDYARAGINPLPGAGRRRSHWLDFVRVRSASASAAKAAALGGRILVEPHDDRHGGQLAVVADPAGAPIGLMEWNPGAEAVEPK